MKNNLLFFLLQLCRIIGIIRLFYWLNRKRKRIITFHNILSDDVFVNNVANGVSNSFSQFKTIINETSKYFRFSLDLNDSRSVTITFDDGYSNQIEIAASYLISKGIPAYLFISGQLLPNSDFKKYTPLTIDLLLHWISYVPCGKYNITTCDGDRTIEVNNNNRLQIWCGLIWPAFLKDSKTKGEKLLNSLDSSYSIEEIIRNLPLKYTKQRLGNPTIEQLEQLKNNGWEIAWHTYSHYPLSKLTYEEKIEELKPDYRICSKVLSYPYGGGNEVDKDCLSIAKALGYKTAVSNINTKNELSGIFFRSRMTLSPDPILIHFELSGLKYFLKYRRLLPKI